MKTIWFVTHSTTIPKYAMRMRTNYLAKYLAEKGYHVEIFSASTVHNTDINLINDKKTLYVERNIDGVTYNSIRTSNYKGNGMRRIINMIQFPFRFLKVSKKKVKKADLIISNPQSIFGILPYYVSRKTGAKFITEVRDLWPESIVAYAGWSKKNIIIKIMYFFEKWIYKHADKIIFTMEGGRDYILDKGWDIDIDVTKIYHVNNGVDLASFNENKSLYTLNDDDLTNVDTFKVIYTGSIRPANNVRKIVEAAKIIKEKGFEKIHFIIYGEGSDRIPLMNYCNEKNISNVTFKGHVDKHLVPSILSRSDLNILHFEQNPLKKYGSSLNKMFEYFASGKPILSDCEFGYDIINRYNAGVSKDITNSDEFAGEILKIYQMDCQQYEEYSRNALRAAKDYDFELLTQKLIDIIENI